MFGSACCLRGTERGGGGRRCGARRRGTASEEDSKSDARARRVVPAACARQNNLESELAERAADVVAGHLGGFGAEEVAERCDGALAKHLQFVPCVAWVGDVDALEQPLRRVHRQYVSAGELWVQVVRPCQGVRVVIYLTWLIRIVICSSLV